MQKVKGAAAVVGLQLHDRREREHSNTNPDINRERSKDNYVLIDTPDKSFNALADERIKAGYTGSKAIRKDAVKVCEMLFTSDTAFFEGKTIDEQKNYFENCLSWAKKRFGTDNIFAANVHLDEATPHLHLDFVPLTADGRLSAKTVLGDRFALQRLQDDFYENVSKRWGLERGNRAELDNPEAEKPKKHLETAAYKREEYVRLQKEVNILTENKSALKQNVKVLQNDIKEIESEKFRLLRENSDNFVKAKEAVENIISEAHRKAAEILSKAQGSIESLDEEENVLKRKIEGLQSEYKKARQDMLQKLFDFTKKIEQERAEKEKHLANEATKYDKTTAMIKELSNPESFRKTFGGVKMSQEDFDTLSGAAVQCYAAQNEAEKFRNEVIELKSSYYGERYKSLKNLYDNCLQEITDLKNEKKDLNFEISDKNDFIEKISNYLSNKNLVEDCYAHIEQLKNQERNKKHGHSHDFSR